MHRDEVRVLFYGADLLERPDVRRKRARRAAVGLKHRATGALEPSTLSARSDVEWPLASALGVVERLQAALKKKVAERMQPLLDPQARAAALLLQQRGSNSMMRTSTPRFSAST